MLFGWTSIATSLVLAWFTDSLSIDLLAIVLIFMGNSLREGFRDDIKWPAIWCGYYCAMLTLMLVILLVNPSQVRAGRDYLIPGSPKVYRAIAVVSVFLAWNAFNLRGLLKHRNGFVNMTDRLWSEEAEDEPVIQE